jgi:hypothetical protein
VSHVGAFFDPALFEIFGLPTELDAETAAALVRPGTEEAR